MGTLRGVSSAECPSPFWWASEDWKVIMRMSDSAVVSALALALALGAASGATAQDPATDAAVKFDRGMNVQPAFEGWVRNSDGTIDLWFGYLNRNWVEELHIPIGPNNNIEPGGPDRGQPTYFYPRRHRYSFKITVPGDWDWKANPQFVWTLTAYGRTDKIYGEIFPEDELVEANVLGGTGQSFGGRAERGGNQPPSIEVDAAHKTVALPSTLTLTALVTDDGLPKPVVRRRVLRSTRPDVPTQKIEEEVRTGGRLTVNWVQHRGPGKATFDPAARIPVADGKAVARVSFSQPGTYVLRAVARDGSFNSRTPADVTVTVTSPSQPAGDSR